MLEGLDKVDWANMGLHVYRSRPQTEIPDAIREVLSDDAEVREAALDFLFGSGQDTGDVHDTTPYIVPFIIEILDEPSVLGKAEILHYLVDICALNVYTGGSGIISIHEQRTQIRTYDALASGIPVYLKFLKDHDVAMRILATRLLGAMSDDVGRIVPALVQLVDEETDESVKVALVKAVGQLFAASDMRQIELRKQYADWFRQLVEAHPMLTVREAAAHASIPAAAMSMWNQRLSDNDMSARAAGVLVEQYLAEPDGYTRASKRTEIVRLLAQLHDPEPLLGLLEQPDLTLEEAQILIRGMLWNLFQNGRNADDFWHYRLSGRTRQANLYHMYSVDFMLPMGDARKQLFQRILAVDKIWELPTNLFSFFFDLPDSRDELRALIEKT